MPDKQIAADNLKKAKEVLDYLGVSFFLFLGTALGAYRDHDFCQGDIDDIDIGIRGGYDQEVIDQIKALMKLADFELEHEWEKELSFIKKYDGWRSKIDFFFIDPIPKGQYVDWSKMYWMFYSTPPQMRIVDAKFFNKFDKVEFYGTTYNIPGPIEEYLEANYGKNWKTPIPRDKWNWETDNKCDFKTIM